MKVTNTISVQASMNSVAGASSVACCTPNRVFGQAMPMPSAPPVMPREREASR